MTGFRIRLLAAVTTAFGLIAGGFEAHLAPQGDGFWHGITGVPSATLAVSTLAAAAMVWLLGSVADVRPFLWMSAGLLPLVPAITGFAPALLFFSGFTCLLLFAILFTVVSMELIPGLKTLRPWSAFLIALGFFIFVGRFLPGPAGPQGDEPHYLLIAESLLRDGDVDLKNQFEDRAYLKFTGAQLGPHTAPRSPRGRIYALHTPGLAVLIAPGYALLGYAGARAVVACVMAAVVGLVFLVSMSRFGSSSARFVFLLATFASPLPIYANAVVPDSVATLPVALTLAWMVSPRPALLGLATACIAALPWVHPRFLPLALLLALSMSVRGGITWRRAAALFVPLLASVGLLLLHFRSLFGSASLSAAYGPGFSSDVSVTRIPWGAFALVLDRQFGLLLFAPVLLIGLPGIVAVWRRDRLLAALLAAVPAGLLAIGGSFSMWWGGASAPSRFLIAAVPALLVVCGADWEASDLRPGRRTLLAGAAGFGLGLLWLACLAPRALHNRSDGGSGLLRLLAPVLDTDRFFPGFVSEGEGLWMALVWGLVLIALSLRPRFWVWFAALPLAIGALTSTRPLVDPFGSTLRALESWQDHRRSFGGRANEDAFVLEVPLGNPPWEIAAGTLRFSPRFSLPSGAWTMQVESQTANTPGALNIAQVSLVSGDEASPPFATQTIRVGEMLSATRFGLEQSVRRVHVRAEGLQARTTIVAVRLLRGPSPP